MKFSSLKYLVLFTLYFISLSIFGQTSQNQNLTQTFELVNKRYGLDQVLVNGRYFEDIYRNDLGHPFYMSNTFTEGEFTLHGKKFSNLELMYNVFDQNLVVLLKNEQTNGLAFLPPIEFVSEFEIAGNKFKKYNFTNAEPAFYQEVYSGTEIKHLVYYSKIRYDSYHNVNFKAYKYTETKKNMFISITDKVYKYSSKGSFLKLFPKENKKEIARYIKDNKVHVLKSPVQEIIELYMFCDQLLAKTN